MFAMAFISSKPGAPFNPDLYMAAALWPLLLPIAVVLRALGYTVSGNGGQDDEAAPRG